MQRAPKLQWLKFSAMLLMLGAFISILIYVLVARDELTATDVDVPLIKAAENPVKRRPENPGGLDIPNRDRVVFDLLQNTNNGADTAATDVTPEEIALTLTEVTPAVTAEKAAEITTKIVETTQAVTTEAPDAIATLLGDNTPQKDTATRQNATERDKTQQNATAPTAPKKVEKARGNFGVQLASFAQKSDADQAVKRYTDKYKSTLESLSPDIQRADLGATGIRYRVRFFGAETKSAANDLCKQLKAQGQGCFAVSR